MSEIPIVWYLGADVAQMLSEQLGREIKYQTLLWVIRQRQIDPRPRTAPEIIGGCSLTSTPPVPCSRRGGRASTQQPRKQKKPRTHS
jgi:hypothetical protein